MKYLEQNPLAGDPDSLFPDFQHLQSHMEEMWTRLTGGQLRGPRFCPPVIHPAVDVYETPEHVVVLAELAGISGGDVEVAVEGDRLAFRGEKHDRHSGPSHSHSQIEICYGVFERSLVLPAQVEAEGIEVSYEDGYLKFVLRKHQRQAPRQVRVNVPVRKA